MTQNDITIEMNLIDSIMLDNETNDKRKYIPKRKQTKIRKLDEEVFDKLYSKFEEMKEINVSQESMIVISKELMDLTKRCKTDVYIREKLTIRIVGLLCFCLKNEYTTENVVDCLLIILNNIGEQYLPNILNSIVFNFPEPSNELIPLIQTMTSLFTEFNISLEIQKVLIEYLLNRKTSFDRSVTQLLVELLENVVKNSNVTESLEWLFEDEHLGYLTLISMVSKNTFKKELLPSLFSKITFPSIYFSLYFAEILSFFKELFRLNWRELIVEFDCYIMYLLNAIDGVINCTDGEFNCIYNEMVFEKMLNNVSAYCQDHRMAQILFETYDCNQHLNDIFKTTIKVLNNILASERLEKHHFVAVSIIRTLFKGIEDDLRNHHISDNLFTQYEHKQTLTMLQSNFSFEKCFEQYKAFHKIQIDTVDDIVNLILNVPYLNSTMILEYLFADTRAKQKVFEMLCKKMINVHKSTTWNLIKFLQKIKITRNIDSSVLLQRFIEEERKAKKLHQIDLLESETILELYCQVWIENEHLTVNAVSKMYPTYNKKEIENILDMIYANPPYLSSRIPPADGECDIFIKSKYYVIKDTKIVDSNTISTQLVILFISLLKSSFPYLDIKTLPIYSKSVLSFINCLIEDKPDLVDNLIRYYLSVLVNDFIVGEEISEYQQQLIIFCFTIISQNHQRMNDSWKDVIHFIAIVFTCKFIEYPPYSLQLTIGVQSFLKRYNKKKVVLYQQDGDEIEKVKIKITSFSSEIITQFFTSFISDCPTEQLSLIIPNIFYLLNQPMDEDIQISLIVFLMYIILNNQKKIMPYWNELLSQTFKINFVSTKVNICFIECIIFFFQQFLKNSELSEQQHMYTQFFMFCTLLPDEIFNDYSMFVKEVMYSICTSQSSYEFIKPLHYIISNKNPEIAYKFYQAILNDCQIEIFYFLFESIQPLMMSCKQKDSQNSKLPILFLNYIFNHIDYFNETEFSLVPISNDPIDITNLTTTFNVENINIINNTNIILKQSKENGIENKQMEEKKVNVEEMMHLLIELLIVYNYNDDDMDELLDLLEIMVIDFNPQFFYKYLSTYVITFGVSVMEKYQFKLKKYFKIFNMIIELYKLLIQELTEKQHKQMLMMILPQIHLFGYHSEERKKLVDILKKLVKMLGKRYPEIKQLTNDVYIPMIESKS